MNNKMIINKKKTKTKNSGKNEKFLKYSLHKDSISSNAQYGGGDDDKDEDNDEDDDDSCHVKPGLVSRNFQMDLRTQVGDEGRQGFPFRTIHMHVASVRHVLLIERVRLDACGTTPNKRTYQKK